jgi:glycerol kinase
MPLVLALDQGTTSSRAVVLDEAGRVLGRAQRELRQHFPRPGWVEHDPVEIARDQVGAAREAMTKAGVSACELAAVGIANQRETTILWDRATGAPLHRAIVWQDRRTAAACERLRADGHESLVRAHTGLVLDPYFSATKLAWLLDHVEGARARAERGELAFGTVDSWLAWRLTGGRADRGAAHVTDPTNASRTLLYDLHAGDWSDALLDLFGIPRAVLPRVVPTSGVAARTHPDVLGAAVPIAALAGDQQAALFGQRCARPGQAKNTYGTGSFVVAHAGRTVPPTRRTLATVAWHVGGTAEIALEGSIFSAGAAIQWLRDGLGLIASASDVEPLAASVPDSGGVALVPAFTGLGAPHWDPHARGTLTGLTRGTTSAHVARAALDGIAHQVADVVETMRDEAGLDVRELRADGGAAANDLLMQIQADLLGVPVVRAEQAEATAFGAAALAGLAVGVWSGSDALDALWTPGRTFEPQRSADRIADERARWRRAVERSLGPDA